MTSTNLAAVILAAGKGTRMKSDLPKVMHRLASQPMVVHVQQALAPLKPSKSVVVIAPGMQSVRDACSAEDAGCAFAEQTEQLGTGHAVLSAESALSGFEGIVLILFGDTPLITTATLKLLADAAKDAAVAVLGMRASDPTGYGRLVLDRKGRLSSIVEHKDASDKEKKIDLCNSGVMAVQSKHLWELLKALGNKNASGEYYLTDIVAFANKKGLGCAVAEGDFEEVMGINSRSQLAEAEKIMQSRLREGAMASGVTLTSPETVFFSADTKLGKDCIVHPFVTFGPGVTVGERVEIRSFCHLEKAKVGNDVILGPYARLRPGADLSDKVRIGNFVEVKAAKLHEGSKVNHLTYIGDAEIGAGANIGAGTITCNYDGFNKYKTEIGEGAFIGSNSSLVAPVKIGEGAIVGAGSVITEDVPAQGLAIERSEQANISGGAERLRDKRKKNAS